MFCTEGSTIVENATRINQNQTRLLYDETFRFFAASKPKDAAEIIQDFYVKYWQEHGKQRQSVITGWQSGTRILHCVSGKLTDSCRNCIKSPRNRSKNVLAFLCIYGERQEK